MVDESQKLHKVSIWTAKIAMCVAFAFLFYIFIVYGVLNGKDNPTQQPFRFVESWTIIDSEGKTVATASSYSAEKEYDKEYTAIATLPQDTGDNEFLFLYFRNDVAVYINGEKRMDCIEARDVSVPGGLVKRTLMMVPLKHSDAGAEVKLVTTSTKKDDLIVSESFVSTRYGALNHMLHDYGFSFFLALIVLIFSFVAFIVSIVLRFWYKLNIDMTFGSLGILILAAWIMSDSLLFPFISGVYYAQGLINYLLCLMIPFAPALYLNSVQKGRYKKIISGVLIATSINALLWPTLHITGILPFYKVRTIMNVILVTMCVLAIGVLIVDAVRGNVKEYRYTYIGFMGFLTCGVLELSGLILIKNIGESAIMVVGLAFFLTFVVIQQVNTLRHINIEKQRAIDVSEAKTKFLASMSHEIRTPINAILGMNEMILRENRDEVVDEYSRSIKTSGKMLLMLVNDVLDFSKIEAGKLEINESPFLLSEMLYDVISLVKERADEKHLELKTEISNEIPNGIISDEFRIRQILVNLINNAIKYTEKGTVTLVLGGHYSDDTYKLRIDVKDTGQGIRREDQPHLFEAFSRADAKANANIEGTGLGLAIVKSIVDSMGGVVGVDSEYGVGSDFYVSLPVAYTDKTPLDKDFAEHRASKAATVEGPAFTAPDAKILAVDDNSSNLTIVKLFLKRTGIVPDLCSSGDRAAELCREKTYDLIFLDHMMPHPDGIETLHIIREDEASLNRDTKAVVLTANAVAGSRQLYMAEGFDEYLTKPIDSNKLEQLVMKLLPENKVIMRAPEAESEADTAKSADTAGGRPSIRERLSAIDGLDYDTALLYCGNNEEFLEEIITTVIEGCPKHSDKLRKSLADKDMRLYATEAHSVKSTMATIGLADLSERARKHEFAAKENNLDFVLEDGEGFIDAYIEVCRKLEG